MASGAVELGLLGRPVSHSLSPVLHEAALGAVGLRGRYRLHDVGEGELAGWVARLREGEVDGLNVTIPHKIAAAGLCDRLVGPAAALGVVNTLARGADGQVEGSNTDVVGLRRAIAAAFPSTPIVGAPVCVIGAGGAAHAAVLAAAAFSPSQIRVANRTADRGRALVSRLSSVVDVPLVALSRFEDAAAGAALLLQATSYGMGLTPGSREWESAYDKLRPVVGALGPAAGVMDLVYRPPVTVWCAAAHHADKLAAAGLQMLVNQAVESFGRWTGRRVDPGIMMTAAKEALATGR